MTSPINRPAMCAGAARPSMISAMAAAASSLVRSSRRVSLSISAANTSVRPPFEEVPQDAVAFAGQNRLGMKLHAVHRKIPMPKPHDRAVFLRARRNLEIVREPFVRDDERVIARRKERLGDSRKQTLAVVLDRRRLAVHWHTRTNDLAAEHRAHRLMPEAHAEDRRRGAELADDVHRDAGVFGASWPRRDHDALAAHRCHLGHRRRVVAHNFHVGAQLAEVLHQVVSKRIVVVDDENHAYNPCCASSRAVMSARALSRVSSYSAVGFESMTMPAPAWT